MKPVNASREEVIQDMKRVYEEYGKLTSRFYNDHGKYSRSYIEKRWTFNELKMEVTTAFEVHSQVILEDELLADVLRVKEECGKLTQELYLEHGRYSRKPIIRLFGSWNNMLKHLDIELNCEINITEEDLLDDLKRIFTEYDAISATVVKHQGKYSVEVYQRRFGSFNRALELAGLDSTVRGRTSPTANSMIRMIESILHEQAEAEMTAEWLINPATGRNLYVDALFPAHNLAFEYNGAQHYEPVERFGGEKALMNRIELDELKMKILKDHGYNLLIFKWDEPHTRQHMIVKLGEIFRT